MDSPSTVFRLTARHPRSWALAAVVVATLPVARGLSASRIFYIRDLSLSFWGRFLWLRHTLLSGQSPLWDPYVGGGQAAHADALHQMFMPLALATRFAGSEVFSFNLWVLVPFPLAALGAWLFFARRHSAFAAALGAVAFALCGPVVSTGNFPNMSWAVASVPWVLWAVDVVTSRPVGRSVALLAILVALQALSGEPVTLFATLAVGGGYALACGLPPGGPIRDWSRRLLAAATGVGLGLALAAVQLLPMARAAALSDRAGVIAADLWSFHPLALLETISIHLFGDYYTSQSLADVPWMPILNTGREPFFFSTYLGVPLLALAVFGAIATPSRRWARLWTCAGLVAVFWAFGRYTPVYPAVRALVPFLRAFRFPIKYLIVTSLAVCALAVSGVEALLAPRDDDRRARMMAGSRVAIGLALGVGVAAYLAAAACLYAPTPAAFRLYAIAKGLGALQPVEAAAFMLTALPRVATLALLLSLATALLVWLAAGGLAAARPAAWALAALIAGDLLVRAWHVNPAFDPGFLAQPEWTTVAARQPDASVYVGGKRDGTLDALDVDGSRRYTNPPGLTGSASRAGLSTQAVLYPSAWRTREILAYDLAVLWPRAFDRATKAFQNGGREERDLFLDRTGVRYRILTPRVARDRPAVMKIPHFYESYLYDWGEQVAPRVSVVSTARLVVDTDRQVDALFEPDWDRSTTVLVDREMALQGEAGVPQVPAARIAAEAPTAVTVEARTGDGGGYLVMLDSWDPDWHVEVDGRPSSLARANGLFRAVRLAPGAHRVQFTYSPRALWLGVWLSAAAGALVLALAAWPARRSAR